MYIHKRKIALYTLISTIILFGCCVRSVIADEAKYNNFILPAIKIKPPSITPKTPNIQNDISTSLSDHIKTYSYIYADTYFSTLHALLEENINIKTINSAKGTIEAELANGKKIYIMVLSSNKNLSHVRITPADGVYDIKISLLKNIFKKIDLKLTQTSSK